MKLTPYIASVFSTALIWSLLLGLSENCLAQETASALYHAGKIEEAREAYRRELLLAEHEGTQAQLWQALMSVAWFEDETGHPRPALEYSNRALELANKIKDPFMIGRSLCWLGWAYSSLGLYELAMEFYQEAVEIGAPGGKITIVPVWGLATQELGAIYFKMGDVRAAKETITRTTAFAKSRDIAVGVAEGGAHLAEIALVEGDLNRAEASAKEAVQAALDCGCSQFNIARAKVTLAKVAFERARSHPEKKSEAMKAIEEALAFAERSGNKRPLAEAKILLSKALPPDQFQQRMDLVSSALEYSVSSESELRGSAESEVGRVFLQDNQLGLAEFYLKQGFKVNEKLFRKVDNAFILADIGELHGLAGDLHQSWKTRVAAADRALSTGALALALQQQELLATELEEHGYLSLAQRWTKNALNTIEKILATQNDPDSRAQTAEKRLGLMEKLASLQLLVVNSGAERPSPLQ